MFLQNSPKNNIVNLQPRKLDTTHAACMDALNCHQYIRHLLLKDCLCPYVFPLVANMPISHLDLGQCYYPVVTSVNKLHG